MAGKISSLFLLRPVIPWAVRLMKPYFLWIGVPQLFPSTITSQILSPVPLFPCPPISSSSWSSLMLPPSDHPFAVPSSMIPPPCYNPWFLQTVLAIFSLMPSCSLTPWCPGPAGVVTAAAKLCLPFPGWGHCPDICTLQLSLFMECVRP